MSHSKRNNSLAFFTSYERSLLRNSWGSQSTRLTRDSFLPFASCRLCLLSARDPVACSSGSKADILCRECALNDLVAQRKEIKRLERVWEGREVKRGEDKRRVQEEGARRELERFERAAQGLGSEDAIFNGAGKKRKASELGPDGGSGDQQHRIENTLGKTETSFWVPGIDTSASKTEDPAPNHRPTKLHPICPASTPSTKHHYSLKSLITVHFTEERGDAATNDNVVRICPSCKKGLGNRSKAVLTRPCGHVLCGSCVDKFMTPPDTPDAHDARDEHGRVLCYVCETDVTGRERRHKVAADVSGSKTESRDALPAAAAGLVEISCEGTGFAGGGSNMAKREGVAFQC